MISASQIARIWIVSGVFIGLIPASGCFSYVPIELDQVSPEHEVRVRLSDEARLRLSRELGTLAGTIDGRLNPLSPDSLALAVWVGGDYADTPFQQVRQGVALGRNEVLEVRRRELSVTRTALTAAGALAAVVILVHTMGSDNILDPGGEEPPPPPELKWDLLGALR